VLVAVLILRSAWSLLRKSTSILMEETPDSVDPDALRQALLANVPGVRDVHDLHCWSLTSGQTMLTLHVGLAAGAAVMVGILVWVQATVDFESGVFSQITALLLLVATGAVTYWATVFALWRLANRPDGAERFLSERVARRFRPPQ
jgi:hypothetical protein